MSHKKKSVAVILSGCGFLDGSEITETISTLIALDRENCAVKIFAPDLEMNSINHLTREVGQKHSMLEHAARIARGHIFPLEQLMEKDFDALVFPGGYGAAKNLCSWANEGAKCSVLPTIEAAIRAFHAAEKPIGAICIAPVILAKVLGKHQVTITIGSDTETAKEVEKTGAIHETCPVDEYVSDRFNKVLSTPAYMYETSPAHVFNGISKMIRELVEMA